MIAAEFVQAPREEEPVDNGPLHVACNNDGDDDDEGEDALSLCNLSLSCDAADHSFADDDASTLSSSPSSSSVDDDFFEFSSVGDSDSFSSDLRSDDHRIVFCGKLIPPREALPPPTTASTEKKRSPLQTGRGSPKRTSWRTRSPTVRRRKCRWYLMAFGLARFPTEMALSEMRKRQSHKVEKTRSCDGGGGDIVRSGDCDNKSKGKWLFGLLKGLGVGHRRRADALVRASLGCVPRV